ncbi:MAG: ROK family protein [Patescibacteria group bacterium]|nr:ROK family protein [Patescibacteria group bacterium]MDD5715974.1 ROK family protein [Patescibacteria group bacterium]
MATGILGLDIGGTKIQIGLVSDRHRVIRSGRFLIDPKNATTALASIKKAITIFRPTAFKAIGIGITGLVDHARGISIMSPNLPRTWHRVPLKKLFERRYHVPVAVDNDAHCIALADALVGDGKKYQTVFSITIGTGIGAGLVVGKRLYRGAQNSVEFGHTIIAQDSPPCSCGKRGHLEALVSGRAMVNLYRQRTGKTLTTYGIVAAAAARQRDAVFTVKTMSNFLSHGFANAIHAYNPEIIVVGGGLSQIPRLVQNAVRATRQLLLSPELRTVRIVRSSLCQDAGVIGAALLAQQKFKV